MRNSTHGITLPLAAVFLVLSGCGGGSSSDPIPTTTLLVSQTVTAAGGTVPAPGGPIVEIPPGALSADTVITITASSEQRPGGMGRVYELGPSGTTFAQPVTVSFPVPNGTTAAAVWTRSTGASQFASLPTTISGGMAVAVVDHFSTFVVGPPDFAGTWAGQVSYTVTNADGSAGAPGTTVQTRELSQSVGEVSYAITNSAGSFATCSGTLVGNVMSTTCTIHNLQETCSASYQPGGTISGTLWNTTSAYTWQGSCPSAGVTVTVSGTTLTKQGGPPMNLSGTYARSSHVTLTGPGGIQTPTVGTGTVVRTQAPGSSAVRSTVSMDGGATFTCLGNVVGNAVYTSCYGSSGAVSYNVTGTGTAAAGPPLTVTTQIRETITNHPTYTAGSGTVVDVKQ